MKKYFDKVDLPCYDNVIDELRLLEKYKQVSWFKPTNTISAHQICLNAPPGYTHDVSFGAGYFADKGKSDFFVRHTPQGDVRIPMKSNSVYSWELCDVFIGTVFENIYNCIKEKYTLGRVRLLKSIPRTCMNWHIDPIARIHYPVQTDTSCLMIIEDEVYHLPENEWTLAKTNLGYHTALNASNIERIHLVADLLP